MTVLSHGRWTRGQTLAERAGVRLELLWFYLERLRKRGLQIEGEPGQWGRGYRMLPSDQTKVILHREKRRDDKGRFA